MKIYDIAVIGGDGIGPQVVDCGIQVMNAAAAGAFTINWNRLDWGSARYLRGEGYMPDDGIEILNRHAAVYFGAVGSQEVPDHVSLRELRIRMCNEMNLEVCLRPAWMLLGVQSPLKLQSPTDFNIEVIRQNKWGEYAGEGTNDFGSWRATDVAIYAPESIARIAEYAFRRAMARTKHLIYATKSNAMPFGMVKWDETIEAVGRNFPEVRLERVLTDALFPRIMLSPESVSVVLATNLHGDFLTDFNAGIMGSMGLAPSANLDPAREHPGVFEPVHGSGYVHVGKNTANPIGAILSGVLMLRDIGEEERAGRIAVAVEQTTAAGIVTPDLGGTATTDDVTNAIIERLPG